MNLFTARGVAIGRYEEKDGADSARRTFGPVAIHDFPSCQWVVENKVAPGDWTWADDPSATPGLFGAPLSNAVSQ